MIVRENMLMLEQYFGLKSNVYRVQQQQQQHSLFFPSKLGSLEMKPERNKFKVQAH